MLPITFFLLGCVLAVIGYLIRYRGKTHLIAGYDPRKVEDEQELAKWSGNKALLLGCITVFFGVLVLLLPALEAFLMVIYAVLLVISSVHIHQGLKRFQRT